MESLTDLLASIICILNTHNFFPPNVLHNLAQFEMEMMHNTIFMFSLFSLLSFLSNI